MKLDTKSLRYLTNEDWRVLTAVETGSRNHEVVPTPLIVQLSSVRGAGGVHRSISTLAKASLIAKVKNATYDGYRLTYGGLDYLSLHAHLKHSTFTSLGSQIGTGKESDIYLVASSSTSSLQEPTSSTPKRYVLKIHRLGRTSFRTVKTNRDYLRHRKSSSWMHMARLAAFKESTFMRALHEAGFPVPEPIAHNRHTVVMEWVDGWPLRQMRVEDVPDPAGLYAECMELAVRLARRGLIHGDLNEFNILIREEEGQEALAEIEISSPGDDTRNTVATKRVLKPILIDFPQMVSTSHANAASYFARDVNGLKRFFERKFSFVSEDPGPHFDDYSPASGPVAEKGSSRRGRRDVEKEEEDGNVEERRLDVQVEASGFSRKMAKELEAYLEKEKEKEKEGGATAAADDDDDDDAEEEQESDEAEAEADTEKSKDEDEE